MASPTARNRFVRDDGSHRSPLTYAGPRRERGDSTRAGSPLDRSIPRADTYRPQTARGNEAEDRNIPRGFRGYGNDVDSRQHAQHDAYRTEQSTYDGRRNEYGDETYYGYAHGSPLTSSHFRAEEQNGGLSREDRAEQFYSHHNRGRSGGQYSSHRSTPMAQPPLDRSIPPPLRRTSYDPEERRSVQSMPSFERVTASETDLRDMETRVDFNGLTDVPTGPKRQTSARDDSFLFDTAKPGPGLGLSTAAQNAKGRIPEDATIGEKSLPHIFLSVDSMKFVAIKSTRPISDCLNRTGCGPQEILVSQRGYYLMYENDKTGRDMLNRCYLEFNGTRIFSRILNMEPSLGQAIADQRVVSTRDGAIHTSTVDQNLAGFVPDGITLDEEASQHIFIPTMKGHSVATGLKKHFFSFMRDCRPSEVLVSSRGYHLIFSDDRIGRLARERCYSEFNGRRMFRGSLVLRMQISEKNGRQGRPATDPSTMPVKDEDTISRNTRLSTKDALEGDDTGKQGDIIEAVSYSLQEDARAKAARIARSSGAPLPSDDTPTMMHSSRMSLASDGATGRPCGQSANTKDGSVATSSVSGMSSNAASRKKCHMCKKVSAMDLEPLVLCSTCPRRYHRHCHVRPPIPPGLQNSHDWQCHRCVVKGVSARSLSVSAQLASKIDELVHSEKTHNVDSDGHQRSEVNLPLGPLNEAIPFQRAKSLGSLETLASNSPSTVPSAKSAEDTKNAKYMETLASVAVSNILPSSKEATPAAISDAGDEVTRLVQQSFAKQPEASPPKLPTRDPRLLNRLYDRVKKRPLATPTAEGVTATPVTAQGDIQGDTTATMDAEQTEQSAKPSEAGVAKRPVDSIVSSPQTATALTALENTPQILSHATTSANQSPGDSSGLTQPRKPQLAKRKISVPNIIPCSGCNVQKVFRGSSGLNTLCAPCKQKRHSGTEGRVAVDPPGTPAVGFAPDNTATAADITSLPQVDSNVPGRVPSSQAEDTPIGNSGVVTTNRNEQDATAGVVDQQHTESTMNDGNTISTPPTSTTVQQLTTVPVETRLSSIHVAPPAALMQLSGGDEGGREATVSSSASDSKRRLVVVLRLTPGKLAALQLPDPVSTATPESVAHHADAVPKAKKKGTAQVVKKKAALPVSEQQKKSCMRCRQENITCTHTAARSGLLRKTVSFQAALGASAQGNGDVQEDEDTTADSQDPLVPDLATTAGKLKAVSKKRSGLSGTRVVDSDGVVGDASFEMPSSHGPDTTSSEGPSKKRCADLAIQGDTIDLGDANRHPQGSYRLMIEMALKEAHDHRLQTKSAIEWIVANIPGYETGEKDWGPNIAATFSAHKEDSSKHPVWQKIAASESMPGQNGKGSWWKLLPGVADTLYSWDRASQKPVKPPPPGSRTTILKYGPAKRKVDADAPTPTPEGRGLKRAKTNEDLQAIVSNNMHQDDTSMLDRSANDVTSDGGSFAADYMHRNYESLSTEPARGSEGGRPGERSLIDDIFGSIDKEERTKNDGFYIPAPPAPTRVINDVHSQGLEDRFAREMQKDKYGETDLFGAWGGYPKHLPPHPEVMEAKKEEIRKRPNRKGLIGKGPTHSRLDQSTQPEPALTSSNRKPAPKAREQADDAAFPWENETSERVEYDNADDFFGLPQNAMAVISDRQLAYRDGTRNERGELPRAKVLYKPDRE